ncbi:hypothetical protein B0H13DRAFT_2380583, partial [Mycena leptocephala]
MPLRLCRAATAVFAWAMNHPLHSPARLYPIPLSIIQYLPAPMEEISTRAANCLQPRLENPQRRSLPVCPPRASLSLLVAYAPPSRVAHLASPVDSPYGLLHSKPTCTGVHSPHPLARYHDTAWPSHALIFKPVSLRHRPHRQRARRRAPSSKLSHSDYLIAIHAVPGIRLQRSGVPLPQRSQAAPKRTSTGSALAHDPTVPSIGVLPRISAHFIVTQRCPIPRPTQSHALRHHRCRLHSSLQHHDRPPLSTALDGMHASHAYHDLHVGDGEYAAVAHCAARRESPGLVLRPSHS